MFRKRPLLSTFAAALLGVALFPRLIASPPAWWSDPATQVLDPAAQPDNYAPANLGQLKNYATQAKKHLDQQLSTVGGAGTAIDSLVAGFQKHTPDNFAPVNLGQLKRVAKPFYDRLILLGVDTRASLIAHGYPSLARGDAADWPHTYPWNPNDPWNMPAPPGQQVDKTANYAPANLGQLKMIFSFDANQDTDSDGIPDWWETKYGLDLHNPGDAFGMALGGLTYLQKFLQGLDPTKADTDGDGVIDSLDGAPLDPDLSPSPVPEARYAVLDLTLAGLSASDFVTKINNKCQLIGSSPAIPFYWDKGQRTEIPMDWATDINNNGVVSGLTIQDADYYNYVARWSVGQSQPEFLYGYEVPLLGQESLDFPIFVFDGGINDSGTIVGASLGSISNSHRDPDPQQTNAQYYGGTIWNGTTPQPVGQMKFGVPGDSEDICRPIDLNNAGIIVGSMANGPYDAFVLEAGAITRLPKLPTPAAPFGGTSPTQYPWASIVNQSATVIAGGMSQVHPVIWVKKQGVWKAKNIGPYNATTHQNEFVDGGIYGINERMEMVCQTLSNQPTLWQNGKLVDLNTRIGSGWRVSFTNSINDSGVISARVYPVNQSGQQTGGTRSALLLPVELYSDMNNDGKVDATDSSLTGLPYKQGATDDEKDKGTEFMFANDDLSNGAWDKDDTVTTGKPANAGDDDAEEIHIAPGITEGEVWLDYRDIAGAAIAGLKFYEEKSCTTEIHLSPAQHRTITPGNPFPARVFARAESVTFPAETTQSVPRPNPQPPVTVNAGARQVEGDLKLWIKLPGGPAAGVEAAKMKLTIVEGIGADKFYRAAIDYIYEQNTSYCTRYISNGWTKSRCTVMLASQSVLVGINAKPPGGGVSMHGIDSVIAAAPNQHLTVVMNCTYAADDGEKDGAFYKLFRGTLWTGLPTYDDSCSIVSPFDAGNGPGMPDIRGYVTDKTVFPVGGMKFGTGEVPNLLNPNPEALYGTGGLPKGGASDAGIHGRTDGWTCLAEIKIDNERLLVTAVADPNPNYPPIQFATDLTRPHNLENSIYWPDPASSFCYALITPSTPGNPIGTLKTIAKGFRHTQGALLVRQYIKPYIGFVSLPPRLP